MRTLKSIKVMCNITSLFYSQDLNPGSLTHIWGLVPLHHTLISHNSLSVHGREAGMANMSFFHILMIPALLTSLFCEDLYKHCS